MQHLLAQSWRLLVAAFNSPGSLSCPSRGQSLNKYLLSTTNVPALCQSILKCRFYCFLVRPTDQAETVVDMIVFS